ncbi:hypothetical protein [Leptothoe kymatousa]|uniref:Uncharacterized protein n=1 Tax=Leptothoe kymatousa TAU-MAC 1615 TaxID=2364775 RepID=A0ABS5XZA7_9CYAN|nr:hypothetical protein [Leptothoe kymatousa]MBT9310939.1 hypothetical protein [Leptothoe kymatousa TAU-MAC 1615]
MRLWAAGIVYTYIGLQLFNWLTGLHLLSEFGLPLTIVSGLGLAIASQSDGSVAKDDGAAESNSAVPGAAVDAMEAPAAPPANGDSISFTIRKNVRPQ